MEEARDADRGQEKGQTGLSGRVQEFRVLECGPGGCRGEMKSLGGGEGGMP